MRPRVSPPISDAIEVIGYVVAVLIIVQGFALTVACFVVSAWR